MVNISILVISVAISCFMCYVIGVQDGAIQVTTGDMVCEQKNSYRNPPVWVCKEVSK